MNNSKQNSKTKLLANNVRLALKSLQSSIKIYKRITRSKPDFIAYGSAPKLSNELLSSCTLLAEREDILKKMPQGGKIIEIGTYKGYYARKILDIIKPEKLYVADISYDLFEKSLFDAELQTDKLIIKKGLSWDISNSFDDNFFDIAYIDADHSYESVVKDINAIYPKVKKGGYIIFNDFTSWSHYESIPYGVYRAVCEFVKDKNLPIKYLSLESSGYFDVAVQKD